MTLEPYFAMHWQVEDDRARARQRAQAAQENPQQVVYRQGRIALAVRTSRGMLARLSRLRARQVTVVPQACCPAAA